MRRIAGLVLLAGCGAEDLVARVTLPWDDAAPGVVVALRADGAPIASTPRVLAPHAAVDLTFPDEPFTLRLHQQDPLDLSDLERCGVRIGGPYAALPPPRASWELPFSPGTGLGALFPTDASADLRYATCDPSPICDQVEQDYHVLPWTGLGVTHVVAIPNDRWFVAAGPWRPEQPQESRFGLLLGDGQLEELIRIPNERVIGAAWDQAERLYVSFNSGTFGYVDLADPRRVTALAPPAPSGGRLSSRPDGLVVFHPRGGPATIIANPAGDTLTSADFPEVIDRLVMADAERMAAYRGEQVLRYDPAARRFREVGRVPMTDAQSTLVFVGPRLYAIGRTYAYALDDDGAHALPEPVGLTIPTSATAFGGGLLVLGGVGGAALWRQNEWCALATPAILSAFPAAATSLDGRRAAAGSDPDSLAGEPRVLVWR